MAQAWLYRPTLRASCRGMSAAGTKVASKNIAHIHTWRDACMQSRVMRTTPNKHHTGALALVKAVAPNVSTGLAHNGCMLGRMHARRSTQQKALLPS